LAQEIESRLERSFMEQRFLERISSEVEIAMKAVEERLSKALEALEARVAREEDARLRLEQSFIQPHLAEWTSNESEPANRSPHEGGYHANERLGAFEPPGAAAGLRASAEDIALQPAHERVCKAIEMVRAAEAERREATKAGQEGAQPRREPPDRAE
jgi:hypothetical protein